MAQNPEMITTRADLERLGFAGFVRFRDLPVHDVPAAAGVYAVLRTLAEPPRFLSAGGGGHFKGRNPTVPAEALSEAWVDGVDVVYIGKAGAGAGGRRALRKRLDEYRRYGEG
jgi:hypothetical protein